MSHITSPEDDAEHERACGEQVEPRKLPVGPSATSGGYSHEEQMRGRYENGRISELAEQAAEDDHARQQHYGSDELASGAGRGAIRPAAR